MSERERPLLHLARGLEELLMACAEGLALWRARLESGEPGASEPLLGGLLGPWCFRLPLPTWTIRVLIAGAEAPIELCRTIQAAVRKVSPMVLAFRLREVMRSDAIEDLQTCSVPIFYLNGTNDRLLGKRALRSLTAARPDMTVINVPGPHMLLQAAPDTCARHIEFAVGGLNRNER